MWTGLGNIALMLANANKFEHIRHVNTMLGLFVPIITTPVELIDWEGE